MLADLMATPLHPGLDAVHQAIGPDTIAKFLLTSGSTGNPKAVINTQRDDLRQPGDDPRNHGVPEGRAARHRRLAAVESHLWRQSQYRADAVQWRLDVSRRRQADARRHRGDRAQSARDFADGLFQRAEGLRVAAALFARRCGLARKILRPAARDVLLGRGAVAVRLEQPRRARRAGNRLSRADADRARRHRERAVLHVGQSPHQPFRPYRASRVRQRRQAGSRTTASWRFASGGRTSRRAIGASRN